MFYSPSIVLPFLFEIVNPDLLFVLIWCCVAGLRHAAELSNMALDLIEGAKEFEIPHRPDKDLLIRAGINSGSCVAGKLKAADEGTDGAVLIP